MDTDGCSLQCHLRWQLSRGQFQGKRIVKIKCSTWQSLKSHENDDASLSSWEEDPYKLSEKQTTKTLHSMIPLKNNLCLHTEKSGKLYVDLSNL